MKTTDPTKLDGIIRKCQALLARADHPNTPKPEADACRAKMDLLMLQYRISEIGESKTGNIAPIEREFRLCPSDSEFRSNYRRLWNIVIHHFDGMCTHESQLGDDNQPYVVARSVGYESDLRFAEIMFMSAAAAFGGRLEPTVDPEQSEAENALRMRMAGMERNRIAEALWGRDGRIKGSLHNKVGAMVKREAQRQEIDLSSFTGKGVQVNQWRDDYAEGFVLEMNSRLAQLRRGNGELDTGLVLRGRKEATEEKFYELHPNLRPTTTAAEYYNPTDGCKKCQKAKSGYCREHSYLRPRYSRTRYRDVSAMAAGREAARSVDLQNGKQRGGGRLDK